MDPELDAAALLDDAQAREAASARSRERWLREQAAAGATFAGALLDLCEQGAPVVVRTAAGRVHRGVITAVGDGVVVLRDAGAPLVHVRSGAVAAVRPAAAHAVATAGDRPAPGRFDFVTLLADLAADRPRISLLAGGAEPVAVGELRAVGTDVATVALDGKDGGVCHVHLGAITEALIHLL